MYAHSLQTHSWLRWFLLALLLITLLKSLLGWLGKKQYTPADGKLAVFTLVLAHLQFVLGLILFFVSPLSQQGISDMGEMIKNKTLRFWTVEHTLAMFLGIVLITIGRIRSKRLRLDIAKHRTVAVFYGLGLLLILLRIPWERI